MYCNEIKNSIIIVIICIISTLLAPFESENLFFGYSVIKSSDTNEDVSSIS